MLSIMPSLLFLLCLWVTYPYGYLALGPGYLAAWMIIRSRNMSEGTEKFPRRIVIPPLIAIAVAISCGMMAGKVNMAAFPEVASHLWLFERAYSSVELAAKITENETEVLNTILLYTISHGAFPVFFAAYSRDFAVFQWKHLAKTWRMSVEFGPSHAKKVVVAMVIFHSLFGALIFFNFIHPTAGSHPVGNIWYALHRHLRIGLSLRFLMDLFYFQYILLLMMGLGIFIRASSPQRGAL